MEIVIKPELNTRVLTRKVITNNTSELIAVRRFRKVDLTPSTYLSAIHKISSICLPTKMVNNRFKANPLLFPVTLIGF